MGDVVNLDEYRPHTSGSCTCLECSAEWTGVIPAGVRAVQCPECGTHKGVRSGLVVPETTLLCPCCYNDLVFVTAPGLYLCPVCAVEFTE